MKRKDYGFNTLVKLTPDKKQLHSFYDKELIRCIDTFIGHYKKGRTPFEASIMTRQSYNDTLVDMALCAFFKKL